MLQFQAITLFPSPFDMTQQHQIVHNDLVLCTRGHTSYPPCCWPKAANLLSFTFCFFIHIDNQVEDMVDTGVLNSYFDQGSFEVLHEVWSQLQSRFQVQPHLCSGRWFSQQRCDFGRETPFNFQRLCPSSHSNSSNSMFGIRRWELFKEYCMRSCTTQCVPRKQVATQKVKHNNSCNQNGSIYLLRQMIPFDLYI